MISCIFSYSHKDANLVKRIYDDIERSGGKTWRYDEDNMSPDDFQKQYKSVLIDSDYFILIDTPDARSSDIVQEECIWALAVKQDPKARLKEIIVCLGKEHGEWRQNNNPLDSLNYNYVNFSGYDHIDQYGQYHLAAVELCDHLGLKYYSWSKTPRAVDFRIELFDQSHNHIPKEEKDILLNDYKSYELSSLHRGHRLSDRLSMMIDFSAEVGVKMISLYLAKGIHEANIGNYEEATQFLLKGVRQFPEEPRLWAALGSAYFYLNQYELALQAYKNAIDRIQKTPELFRNQERLGDLLHNTVETLIRLHRFDEANMVMESIPKDKKGLPEVKVAKVKLLLHQHKFEEAKGSYSELNYLWENRHLNEIWLNKLLGSLEYLITQFVYNKSDTAPGQRHCERALTYDPGNESYVLPPAMARVQ